MATYLHPGVYIEEIPSGAKPIEGVSTSVAALIGYATAGPIGEPTLVHSWDEYKAGFGEIQSDTDHLGLAAFYFSRGVVQDLRRPESGSCGKCSGGGCPVARKG